MKNAIALTIGLLAGGAVYAQSFAPVGTKATLTVEYEYSSVGQTVDEYNSDEWRVARTLTMVAHLSADLEQAVPLMREMEDSQKESFDNKLTQAESIHTRMAPTMDDIMQMVENCGDDDACVEKAIVDFGMSADPSLMQSMEGDVNEVMKQDAPRYQRWSGLSQTGTYAIDEVYRGKGTNCSDVTANQHCSREETRKGGGDVPVPGEDVTLAQVEFDSVNKDLIIHLPTPIFPLDYTRHVTTDYPDEQSGSFKETLYFPGELPTIIASTDDARNVTGTQTIKRDGRDGESGTLTVKWQFVRH